MATLLVVLRGTRWESKSSFFWLVINNRRFSSDEDLLVVWKIGLELLVLAASLEPHEPRDITVNT
jgi:hypothetical protein